MVMVSCCRTSLLSLSIAVTFGSRLTPPLATAPPRLPLYFKSRSKNIQHFNGNFPALSSKRGFCLNKYYQVRCAPVKLTSVFMEGPPPGYRSNVGVCLFDSNNQVFVASRLDVPGAWQMPQGGVDERESPRDAAIRELREETGVTSADIVAEVPHWLTYDFPPAVKEKIDRLWGGDWKGQAQKWFLLKFTGDENEINLAGDGTEAAEFSDWTWMPPEQVIEQAVDFKRPVYEQVFRFFAPHFGAQSTVL